MCEIENKTLDWSIQRCLGLCWHGNMQSRPQGVVVGGGALARVDCSISAKMEISVYSEHLALLADWPINEKWEWASCGLLRPAQKGDEANCQWMPASVCDWIPIHLCVCLLGEHAAVCVWVVVNMRAIDCVRESRFRRSGTSYYAGGNSFIFSIKSASCLERQQ